MTQSSLTRLLVRVQIGSLIGFIVAVALAMLVMLPYYSSGPVMEHAGAYLDKTGAVRTAVEFERYSLHESLAKGAGALGLVSAAVSMLAGFCLRSR